MKSEEPLAALKNLQAERELKKELEGVDLNELARTDPAGFLDLYRAGLVKGVPIPRRSDDSTRTASQADQGAP